jgi:hypothetical protein
MKGQAWVSEVYRLHVAGIAGPGIALESEIVREKVGFQFLSLRQSSAHNILCRLPARTEAQ